MLCGAGHEAPLRLRGGGDRRLILGARLVTVAGLIALLQAEAAAGLKILLTGRRDEVRAFEAAQRRGLNPQHNGQAVDKE